MQIIITNSNNNIIKDDNLSNHYPNDNIDYLYRVVIFQNQCNYWCNNDRFYKLGNLPV